MSTKTIQEIIPAVMAEIGLNPNGCDDISAAELAQWYVSKAGNDSQGIVADIATGRTIAVSYDVKDAQLLASAPDLLAALQFMDDAFSHYCEGDPFDDEVQALEAARAAIAKATANA